MRVKLFYLNWNKIENDDVRRPAKWTGAFFADRSDLYDLVFTREFPDVMVSQPEDFLFEKFNIGGREGKHIRSMCVGDVVVYDGKAVICQGMGWVSQQIAPSWALERMDEVNEQPGDPPEIRLERRG